MLGGTTSPRPTGPGRAHGQHDGALHGHGPRGPRARRRLRGWAALRAALLQFVAGVLDEGLAAAGRGGASPLHRVGSVVHLEPGWSDEAVSVLGEEGYDVRIWPEFHHFFGGISAVGRHGGCGGPTSERSRDGAVTAAGADFWDSYFRAKRERGEDLDWGGGGPGRSWGRSRTRERASCSRSAAARATTRPGSHAPGST